MPATATDNAGMSRGNLEQTVERIVGVLRARQEVREAYLFGSRSRGDSTLVSDTDIAVHVDWNLRPERHSEYAAQLAVDLITALRGNDVEVVILNDAPPLLYHRVLRDGIRVLARRLSETTEREGRALSRYCDFVPQLRKIDTAHAGRIARGDFGR
jgi:predicted nucleotidyltransferase